MNQYCVYIMAGYRGTLYVGVTNDLERRIYEHTHKLRKGFSNKYNVSKLVHYEATSSVEAALEREKEIKGWKRSKKVALIESTNPHWESLADYWDRDPSTPDSLPSERLRSDIEG